MAVAIMLCDATSGGQLPNGARRTDQITRHTPYIYKPNYTVSKRDDNNSCCCRWHETI